MYVVKRGNLEILKWLLDPNARSDGSVCLWDKWICAYATHYGHLEILKWLLDPNARSDGNGSKGIICPLDIEECMRCAKENNYLEIVELFKQYV